MWRDWEAHNSLFDKAVASGTSWVRADVGWCSLEESGEGKISAWYQARLDAVVSDAQSRGLHLLLTLSCTPSWAGGGSDEKGFPTDPSQFERIAAYIAGRYSGRVAAYEIWNEPDCMNGGCPNGDAGAYVGILKAGYRGIKRADADASVISGGISGINIAWLQRFYAAGAKGYFDALGVHPYLTAANAPPDSRAVPGYTDPYRITNAPAAHELMLANGDGNKTIWFTEFGWTTGRTPGPYDGVTASTQAQYLRDSITLVENNYPYVSHAFWYMMRDRDESSNYENGFGLLTVSGEEKPAYAALGESNAWLRQQRT